MSNIPNLNDMLKLYTKKDLWERIQHHIKRIDNLQQQLDQQKEMWNELKEWLVDTLKAKQNSPKYYKLNEVLDKMQELEKGEKDVKD